MMIIPVELPPEIEERFLAQARVRGLTPSAYAQELIRVSEVVNVPTPSLSADELNRVLDEAADLVGSAPPLSDNAMSR